MGDITRIDASQAVEITDGVSQSAAVATSAPGASDGGLVVRNIPSGTQTVTGTVTLSSQTVTTVPSGTQSVSGTVTNVPSGTQTVAGTVTAVPTGTQAVSGTVTNVPSGTQTVTGTVVASAASSVVSTNNSSTSVLLPSTQFTGTGDSLLGYGTINVSIYTDADSAVYGLQVQQSQDNTNWDTINKFNVQAGKIFNTSVNVNASYVRVVYANGYVAQSIFRLQTLLSPLISPLPKALSTLGNLQVAVNEMPSTQLLVNDKELTSVMDEVLLELKRIRFGISMLVGEDLSIIDIE